MGGGAEAVTHSVNFIQSHHNAPPADKLVLQIDFSNVFNSICRTTMLKEVLSRIPSLSAWFESCYGYTPSLLFGNNVIKSCSSVQQGDPLGPLGFALTLHPIIMAINSSIPGILLNAWYLDDGTLIGSGQHLQQALEVIESTAPSIGLSLNKAKSSVFIPLVLMTPVIHSLRISL